MANLTFGYTRVSTGTQDPGSQVETLRARHIPADRIYRDRASGGSDPLRRTGWVRLLAAVREGDTIEVVEASRLARTTRKLLAAVWDLRERGINVRLLREGIDTGDGSPMTEALLSLLGIFSELERDFIKRRTREGLAAARERGRVGGRPPAIQGDDLAALRAAHAEGESLRRLAARFNVSTWAVRTALKGVENEA